MISERAAPWDLLLRDLLGQGSLTCDLSDLSSAVGVLPSVFCWRSNGEPFLGPAHTVTAPDGDLDAVYQGIHMAEAGSVLVVATGETERAIWGETTTREALHRGVAGVVIDGACRDVRAVRASGLSVVGRGVSPKRAERTGRGVMGNALSLQGVTIHPGDLLVSDENGTAIVPGSQVAHLIQTLVSETRR